MKTTALTFSYHLFSIRLNPQLKNIQSHQSKNFFKRRSLVLRAEGEIQIHSLSTKNTPLLLLKCANLGIFTSSTSTE